MKACLTYLSDYIPSLLQDLKDRKMLEQSAVENLQKEEELKKLREDLVSLHQAKAALEANVREMQLHRMNQEQHSNILTEHVEEFQKQTTSWFVEKANFQSDSEKAHSEVIFMKDSLLNSTVTRCNSLRTCHQCCSEGSQSFLTEIP